jgi:hypothetical protein
MLNLCWNQVMIANFAQKSKLDTFFISEKLTFVF